MKEIEILAPAGSIESLKAAIHASCDAVYIGGSMFGARAYANNLEEEDMLRAIDYAHIHNKKIYLTVNTLLKQQELEQYLFDYLKPFYREGVDAVIVQDVGVLKFIKEHFKGLAIHASTQMSLTMAEGGEVLKPMGVTRMVNARELGLEEIKRIKKNTDLELESFVHGALCFCYSGQCFMSSMIGGRSGNRGRCAQPCRMPYELKGNGVSLQKSEEKYVLSPKDIATIDMIPDLVDAGIDSFKIEGRMKRPEYAAGVTYMYRKYTDQYLSLGREGYEAYLADHKDEYRNDLLNLQDLYNRGGFTEGYYTNRNGKIMMSFNRPNHSGVLIGNVTKVNGNTAALNLQEDIYSQDILEVRNETGSIYEFTVKDDTSQGKTYPFNFNKGLGVRAGNLVYRTKNNTLLDSIHEKYIKNQKKTQIQGELIVTVDKPLELSIWTRAVSVKVHGDIVQAAMNQPMTEEKIRKQLLKTNESNYIFENITIKIYGDVFIPVVKLNELRRSALEELEQEIIKSFYRTDVNEKKKLELASNTPEQVSIHVLVSSIEHLKASLKVKEIRRIYVDSDMVPFHELTHYTDLIKSYEKEAFIAMPYIMRNATYQLCLRNKSILLDDTIDGYLIRNYEEYSLLTKEFKVLDRKKKVISDYNLYVMNQYGKAFMEELGIGCSAPIELNYGELLTMKGLYDEIVVYGNLPLMITAQCLVKNSVGGVNKNFDKDTDLVCANKGIDHIELIDRYQKTFMVKRHCRYCYNTIYNSNRISLLSDYKDVLNLNCNAIRLQFTNELVEEIDNILNAYVNTYLYKKEADYKIKDFTRGHFRRGIE